MTMKKIALSFFVLAASGAYVWSQAGKAPSGDLLSANPPPTNDQTAAVPAPIANTAAGDARPGPQLVPFVVHETPPAAALPAPEPVPLPTLPAPTNVALPVEPVSPPPVATQSVAVDMPLPRLRPARLAAASRFTPVAAVVAANGHYSDGSYTGPQTDAYYGLMRIQAIVQGGRLVAIKVLEYPSDRRTSVAINRQALPMLRDEVIMAQSANVDIITGATLSSRAFIESLGGALNQASSSSTL